MMFALHYTLYFLLLVSVTTIDAMFAPKLDDRSGQRDLNFHLICIDAKAFSAAFSIGLLDFYLADNGVKEVPLVCFPGCLLWCLCVIIRDTFACVYFPAVPAIMARSNSIYSIATASPSFSHGCTAFLSFALREYAILMVWLVSAGLASDFFFSPMHRLTHIPTLYKSLHKEHHAYTNKLTSLVRERHLPPLPTLSLISPLPPLPPHSFISPLPPSVQVLFYGNLLDDFLMPLTTVFGGIITFAWMSHFGFLDPAAAFPLVSGTAFYMFVMLLPVSPRVDKCCSVCGGGWGGGSANGRRGEVMRRR
jgi:hypothetical protein